MKSILDKIKKGDTNTPKRILLYGVEGIGKSTWGAGAPSPLFLCAEDGMGDALAHVDRIVLTSFADVFAAVDDLMTQSHSFKTLVIDTADWLEAMIYSFICARDNKNGVEDYGYGKGYTAAQEELRKLQSKLDDLRRVKSMGVIILAHAQIKAFNNPTGDNYDRYILKGNDKMTGLWKEWVDVILFARYEVFVTKESKKAAKGKAVLSDGRIVHTQWTPAWDGKNRDNLPEILPLDYAAYEAAMTNQAAMASELAEYIATHFETAVWADDAIKEKGLARLGGSLTGLEKLPLHTLQTAANFIKTLQPANAEAAA